MNVSKYVKIGALALALTSGAVWAQQGGATAAAKPAASQPSAYTSQASAYKWKTPKLNRSQVDALLAHPEKLVILDVRRPDELTKIGGFPVYLSIQVADLEKSLGFIPKDRSVLIASNHAGRAGAAGDLLTAKGYKVAGAVGVQNYEEEGGTLTRIAAPAPKPAETAANR